MAARVTKGSKELVEITVKDATGTTTDLGSSTPHFWVYEGADDSGTNRISNMAATVSGMVVDCMVDTSTGTWNKGLHSVYLTFTVGSEVPRLGPFELYLI